MIRSVRVVIYILVLAAIGWFVSRIYIDPKFQTAMAPAVETTPAPTEAAPPATLADAGDYVERGNGETIVDVPTTRVETGGDKRTRVRARAPYTKVDVDTKRRRVRIRVPYYNGDIRW